MHSASTVLLSTAIALALIATPLASARAQAAPKPPPAAAAPMPAEKPMVIKEEKPGLFARAKITGAVATATALAKVPGGRVKEGELEEEDGKLIFSFDIKVSGKSGIEEVAVDAITGAVVGAEHESEADEAEESAKENAEQKASAGMTRTKTRTKTKTTTVTTTTPARRP